MVPAIGVAKLECVAVETVKRMAVVEIWVDMSGICVLILDTNQVLTERTHFPFLSDVMALISILTPRYQILW